ncbi:MAG: hypothetical protein WBV33_11390, partial [Terracidiphilus sp.]
ALPPSGAEVGSMNIVGDAADASIPRYVITGKDADGNQETCRASAKQVDALENPPAHAVENRHGFLTSIIVLCSMFLVLTTGTIGILKKRDSEPQ